MRFDDYLFRCSSLGNIMVSNSKTTLTAKQEIELQTLIDKFDTGKITDKQNEKRLYLIDKRDAKPELAKGAQTHCNDALKESLFNRRKQINNKQTFKGHENEELGLTLASNVLGEVMFKNEKHFTNEFIQGTPDRIVLGKIVDDIKSNWTLDSFPMFDDRLNNTLYKWQIKGYCWLTGCTHGRIMYCLTDTSIKKINDEIRSLDWKIGVFDGNGNIFDDKIQNVVDKVSMMIYTREGLEKFCHQDMNIKIEWFNDFVEIPRKLRFKKYEIDLLDSDIEHIKDQVFLAREYMNKRYKELEL